MLGARPSSQICPVPEKFYYGCLRHDFMWRTMAVLNQATGRVWNERNRYVADQMFLTDHQVYCALDYLDNSNGATNAICQAAADFYHLGVRTGAGFRENLADSERNSVTYGHDDYVSGLVLAPAANCGLRSNRCLPINYLEYEGKPLVPKGLASIPQGVVLEMQLVRANQYAVEGAANSTALLARRTRRLAQDGRNQVQCRRSLHGWQNGRLGLCGPGGWCIRLHQQRRVSGTCHWWHFTSSGYPA